MALPTGTVTMLFTDIEGSTRLLKQLGERYGEVLADHRRLLREAFAAHAGHEIGTEGDSFFVTFVRARDAVAAAVAGQRALGAHAWPDGLECRVRMGMHTGEPFLGEVGYHGLVVHRGARVASAAHGGQVLLSSATAELVQDDLPAGIALQALGERRLKDIDRPEPLYQLLADGLRSDFPPPRTESTPRAAPTLVGRADECELVEQVLEDARLSRSRALVIRGEAGVGKSSLLTYAVDSADGFLVLRATGFEGEAELAFSGLLQLLRPLLDRLDELPPHQAAALGGALGLAPGEETDRLSIGVATLALIALGAEDTDVLVAIDDAQWLDSASSDALLFASRRFEADRVAVIFAVRDEGNGGFATTGFEELRVAGLGWEAARQLAPQLTERLYELTQGNPLALVELPSELSEGQLEGTEPLQLGSRVERAFRGRVQALSPDAQQALLIAAASDSDRLDTIVGALAGRELAPAALQEAEDAGLVELADQSLLFRHPLVRSAVYQSAAPSERRAAHAALAAALTGPRDEERRAWQLASATFAPDEEVAAALERAGDAARERSGYGGASAAYERAARLSPGQAERLRRLLAAGDAAWNAGQTPRAIAILDEALADCRDGVLRGQLLNIRGHIERHVALPAPAYEMLTEAASLLDEVAPIDAAAARVGAWRAAWLMNRRDLRLAVAEALRDRAEEDGGIQEFCACLAYGTETPDREEGRRLLDRAETLVEERGPEVFASAPRLVSLAGMASQTMGQHERGLAVSNWAIGWARERGNYGALPVSLLRRSGFEKALELWPTAYATVSESAAIGAQQGTLHFLCAALFELADLDAMRGDEEACHGHLEEAEKVLDAIGISGQFPAAGIRLALLALSLGRLDEAIERYEALLLERPELHADNLIEALVRAGRSDEAARLLEAAASLAYPGRCRGLVAGDETFEQHFEEALAARNNAFSLGRTRLCYGERLRRARRRRDARDQLKPALEVFERLGLEPWAERTRSELRATGERVRARGPEHEDLTAQELRIALQAAEGKTNRQIGATLFLSPKTVEFHLGRAYRKLGISSRAELIRHFATAELVQQ
jgi:class 3 adenylate cyclase/DNA-binding CsgD family transcriptional regulator